MLDHMVRWRMMAASVLAAPLLAAPAAAQYAMAEPFGWAVIAPSGEYRVGVEPVRRPEGEGALGAVARCAAELPAGPAVLQQSIRADFYRGVRVRLSGYMRTAEVRGEAALWMRVDGNDGTLTSDYMLDRPVSGTTDWTRYDIVLDVPSDAVGISFGLILDGRGETMVDALTLAPVGRDVAVTGVSGHQAGPLWNPARNGNGHTVAERYRIAPLRPVNLDFEQVRAIAAR